MMLRKVGEFVGVTNKRFVASESSIRFGRNLDEPNQDFKTLFLNRVEEDIPSRELVVNELTESAPSVSIMNELGEKKKVALAHFFQFLEKMQNKDPMNGCMALACIQDDTGRFWVVTALWHALMAYWSFRAYPSEDTRKFYWSTQVLSQ